MLRNKRKRGVIAAGGRFATLVMTLLTLCLMGTFGFAAVGCAEESELGGGGGGGSSTTHGTVRANNNTGQTITVFIDGSNRGTVGAFGTRSWSIICGPTTIRAESSTTTWNTFSFNLSCGGTSTHNFNP